MSNAQQWYLYLLECEDGSLYCGIAVEVKSRFAAHLSGKGAKYTRSHHPKKILLRMKFPDRSLASKAEYAVKRLSVAQKRTLCAKDNAARRAKRQLRSRVLGS